MTAEDVRAAAGGAHVAQGQLQDTIGAGVIVAVAVLRATHTPDDSAGTVVGQGACNALKLRTGRACNTLNFFGGPFCNFVADLIHAPNAGTDEFFIFPAVLKDVPQDAPNQRHVRTGPKAYIFVGMCSCAGKARITHDQGRVVFFLRFQQVQQGNRVRFGRVTTDYKDRLAVVDIVVAVGHGTVAPCVGYARNGGRVANPRLVVNVIGTPVCREFAEQISLLVTMLGRTEPIDRIRAAFFADHVHLVADFVDGLFPANADPLATLFFHRVLQAAFSVSVFAYRSAFGAVRPKVERAVPTGFLTGPDAV